MCATLAGTVALGTVAGFSPASFRRGLSTAGMPGSWGLGPSARKGDVGSASRRPLPLSRHFSALRIRRSLQRSRGRGSPRATEPQTVPQPLVSKRGGLRSPQQVPAVAARRAFPSHVPPGLVLSVVRVARKKTVCSYWHVDEPTRVRSRMFVECLSVPGRGSGGCRHSVQTAK